MAHVSGGGAGEDPVREQVKLEATLGEMFENGAESPLFCARFIGWLLDDQYQTIKEELLIKHLSSA